jgi:hypothetical protein
VTLRIYNAVQHCTQCSLAEPVADINVKDDSFEFEWSAHADYHTEQLDVLANDSGTGLSITNVIQGADMVGRLSTASPNDHGIINYM